MKMSSPPAGVPPVHHFHASNRRLEWLWPMLIVMIGSFRLTSDAAEPDTEAAWTLKALKARKAEQFEAATQFKAFHGFQFTNDIQRSGITFENHIVDDCGRD